ncbi:MAG: LuxR C-terminal-related transcriptional regulator [Nannocystales bacterium]
MPERDRTTHRPVTPRRVEPGARPYLVVLNGAHRGTVAEVSRSECTIGRTADSGLVLTDSGVSKRHVKIIRAADGIYNLIDLDSTNGVLVNGVAVDVTVLREGDRIHVGPEVLLRFTFHPDHDAVALAAEPMPLSERQLEVARLVCTGSSNAEIAKTLEISPRTVTSHLDHIYNRLEIGSRAELVHYLTKRGFA